MADYLNVAQGYRPWKPGPDVETVEVFDYYDMPTAGALRQQGVLYLFWCAEGHVQDINVWVYALVQEDELSGLADAGDFYEALEGLIADRPITVAVALEDMGIITSGTNDHPSPYWQPVRARALETATELIKAVERRLEGLRTTAS